MNNMNRHMSKSVLVVDDTGINRLLPGLILRPFGWDVYEVDSAAGVSEVLNKINIDLILLDIIMPEVSGLDVLKNIKNNNNDKKIKIIAYTGCVTAEDTSRLISLGFDAVLLKPLTSIKLLDVLGKI